MGKKRTLKNTKIGLKYVFERDRMGLNEYKQEGALPRMLSINKVAEVLDVSKKTIYRYVQKGQLRAYKYGRDLKFKESDIKAFIEKHEKK